VRQGTVKNGRGVNPPPKTKQNRGRVKFYALAGAVFIHVVGLSIFAGIKLSQTSPIPLQTTAVVTLSRVQTLAKRPAVSPKPKIISDSKKIARIAGQGVSANIHPSYDLPKQELPQQKVELPKADTNFETLPEKAEFFGSPAQGRRICYVVDCSGSMQGLWGQVRAELLESIGQLEQDQYFSVIIFGSGSVLESGGGRLARATDKAKKDAYDFIGSVRPNGTTNAAAAIEYAIKIRDRSGEAPSLIYFLTDGFELSVEDSSRFAHHVGTMLRSFSPKTKINTIGFWPEKQDRKLLETLAKDSGGEFVAVGEAEMQK